jgi:hypothetical protein
VTTSKTWQRLQCVYARLQRQLSLKIEPCLDQYRCTENGGIASQP